MVGAPELLTVLKFGSAGPESNIAFVRRLKCETESGRSKLCDCKEYPTCAEFSNRTRRGRQEQQPMASRG